MKDGSNWWTESYEKVYYKASSSNAVYTKRVRQQLTGLPANAISVTKQWGPHGSLTDGISDPLTTITDTLDKANRKITRTTDVPEASVDHKVITQNGLKIEEEAPSGQKTGFYYDYLNRLTKTLVGSNTPATTTDKDFEKHFGYVTDSPMLDWEKQTSADGSGTLVTTKSLEYEDCGSGLVSEESITYVRNGSSVTETTYYAYSKRKQLTHTWGNAANPVMNEYDDYGRRIYMHTYADGSNWGSSTIPSTDFDDASLQRTTTWQYDWNTGVLTAKLDPDSQDIAYTHDWANRVASRTNARNQAINFTYYPRTGELKEKKYGSTVKVTRTYNRFGAVATVEDDTGTRTFTYREYDEEAPLTLESEALPTGFYGTNNFVTNDVHWTGRFENLALGTSADPDAVSNANWTYFSNGNLNRIITPNVSTTDYLYAHYEDGTSHINGFWNYLPNAGTYIYHVRDYLERRPLVDNVTNHLGNSGTSKTTTFANFDLTRNESGRIEKIEATGDM